MVLVKLLRACTIFGHGAISSGALPPALRFGRGVVLIVVSSLIMVIKLIRLICPMFLLFGLPRSVTANVYVKHVQNNNVSHETLVF